MLDSLLLCWIHGPQQPFQRIEKYTVHSITKFVGFFFFFGMAWQKVHKITHTGNHTALCKLSLSNSYFWIILLYIYEITIMKTHAQGKKTQTIGLIITCPVLVSPQKKSLILLSAGRQEGADMQFESQNITTKILSWT